MPADLIVEGFLADCLAEGFGTWASAQTESQPAQIAFILEAQVTGPIGHVLRELSELLSVGPYQVARPNDFAPTLAPTPLPPPCLLVHGAHRAQIMTARFWSELRQGTSFLAYSLHDPAGNEFELGAFSVGSLLP